MRRDISGWTVRLTDDGIAANRAAGVWRARTIAQDAAFWAENDPGGVCCIEAGREVRFGPLFADARALAASLWDMGVRPGNVVSFQLPNWPEAIVVNVAACLIGAVVNPVIPIYRDAELATILGDCKARVVFIPGTFRSIDYPAMFARLRPALPGLGHVVTVRAGAPDGFEALIAAGRGRPVPAVAQVPDAVKLIMYTSGTTGRPKGVLHTHETAPRAIQACFDFWELRRDDVFFMPSPVTHITGYCYGIEMPFYLRTRTLFMDRWTGDEAVSLIDRYGAACCVGATPFLTDLMDAAERAGSRLPSLRVFPCGGAAVPPAVIHRAMRVFENCRAFRVYGSTEAPVITLGNMAADQADLAAGTDGRIVDYEVRVVDLDGRDVPEGVEGEILARGPALFQGYADPAQTAESFDGRGFFRTGDLGVVRDGVITITDRKKDLIIRGGENLSAKDIEDVLHRHPAVVEVAAVSMPHPRMGETVCVYVIPKGDAEPDAAELADFLEKAGVARQKFPERVELVADLPRTASGKVRKDVLRRMVAEKIGGA